MKRGKPSVSLRAALRIAIERGQAATVGRIADVLRFRGGFNYAETFELARELVPKLEAAEWDGLLYEADELESSR